jgi:Uma2 family endonuclease
MNVSLLDKQPQPPLAEKLVTLHDITWEQFKAIETQLQNNQDVRLTYLSGVMEILSPIGAFHENIKSTLSLLLEAYIPDSALQNVARWITDLTPEKLSINTYFTDD